LAGKALEIELISLPSKCSHAMQPCNVERFAVMKKHFQKCLQLVLDRRPGQQPPKTQLASLINNAAVEIATRQSIQTAFRAAGIWPIDETVYSKQLGPSRLFTEAVGQMGWRRVMVRRGQRIRMLRISTSPYPPRLSLRKDSLGG
jgi:hypothetical protein